MKKLDITLGEAPREGILSILEEIRPEWNKDKIIIKSLKGGHVNRLFHCGVSDDVEESDVLVVRVFGSGLDGISTREKEVLAMRIAHHQDLAAPIYCRFSNGIVYKYHKGITVDFTNQNDETFARLVAKELAKLHATDNQRVLAELGEQGKADLFTGRYNPLNGCLPNIMPGLPDTYDDPEKEKVRLHELMPKQNVLTEVNRLDTAICEMHFPVVFCHNDLNTGNIVYDKSVGRTCFVDWEVAGLNFAISDISSFFVSHVYNSEVKCSPDQFKFYPDKEYQMRWIRWYLQYKAELCGENPEADREDQVYNMYIGTNLAAMNYVLGVGSWYLLQDVKSSVQGDYFSIARHLQGLYWVIKRQLDKEVCQM